MGDVVLIYGPLQAVWLLLLQRSISLTVRLNQTLKIILEPLYIQVAERAFGSPVHTIAPDTPIYHLQQHSCYGAQRRHQLSWFRHADYQRLGTRLL